MPDDALNSHYTLRISQQRDSRQLR